MNALDMTRLHPITRVIVLIFIVGPGAGFLCGLLDASIGMIVTSLYVGEPKAIPLGLLVGSTFAVIFGIPAGFLCMLLVAWSIRNDDLAIVLRHLAGGTLLFALPCACIPEGGVPISLLAGIVGFWLGFARLRTRNFTKHDWRQFVFGKGGYGI